MKRLGLFVLAATLTAGAFAQDLDTVSIVDQFNVGTRGNNTGTGTFGASKPDGSEFTDYTGTDASTVPTTSIRYINTWATDGSPESPVLTVTGPHNNPDRGNALPPIIANTRPGATGPGTAVVLGDDGGYNALFFGNSDDANYYVQVDLFCPVSSISATVADVETAGLVARAARDDGPTQLTRRDYGYSPDLDGSYGIVYNYRTKEIQAQEFPNVSGPSTPVGSPIVLTANGWHTLRIECVGTVITYKVNGTVVGTTPAAIYLNGRPGMFYREVGFTGRTAQERQGIFDQLRAGPPTSDVNDWNLY